jgi:hypothetical protein
MMAVFAALLLGGNALALVATGWLVARRCLPGRGDRLDHLDRVVVAMLVAVVEIVAVLTVLGLVDAIYPASVTGVHLAIYALARWRLAPGTAAPRLLPRSPRAWISASLLAVVIGTAVAFAAGPYSTEPDTMRYHAVNAAHWLQTHSITSLPYAEPGDPSAEQPGNGELIGLWLMLPSHDDTVAHLGNVYIAVLCVLALAAAAARLGANPRTGALAGLAVLLVPIITRSQLHSLSTDLVGATMLMCALALVLRMQRHGRNIALIALAGAAIGVALGTKYVDIAPALLVAVAAVVLLRRVWTRRDFVVFAGVAVALCATWYVRDWVLTGNPLYPLHIAAGPISLGPAVRVNVYGDLLTPLAVHIAHGRWDVLASWVRVASYVVGPALLLVVVALALRRPAGPDRRITVLRLLTVAMLLAYAVTPFTGAGESGDERQLAGAMRFLLPALLTGALLFASIVPARLAAPASVVVLVYGIVVDITAYGRPDFQLSAARVAVGALVAALCLAVYVARTHVVRHARLAGGGIALAGVVALALTFAWLRPANTPTTIDTARAMIGRPDAAVVVMNVLDARQLIGPRLDVVLTAVGDGPVGRQTPIADSTDLSRAIAAGGPVVVAVGEDGSPDPRPRGWRVPASWRHVGTQLDAEIYVVEAPGR